MSENSKMVKAAGTVGIYTLASRILGFVRDMMMAWLFGSGMITDAFIAAFRLPNLMRRLLAEGSLVLSFIPVFTETLEKNGRDEAFRLAESSFKVLSVILAALTFCGILLASYILMAIAPGFMNDPEKMELTVTLTRVMFPYVFFICLVALCMGVLNALGHFAAPALAPVVLNVVMIVGLWGGSHFFEDSRTRIGVLAFSVIAGGALQLSLQAPFMWKMGFRFRRSTPFLHPGVRQIGRLMLPSIVGAGVYQVNVVSGTILASFLLEGSITWLYYADRVFQFPLGIFAISMGTAVLPSLSRQAAAGDMEALKQTFSQGLRFVFYITLPATAGLIALAGPIVSVLFRRGEFGANDLDMTARALVYYSAGLCPVAAVRVAAPVFYARKDAVTPVRIAVISIILNILLSIVLMGPMKHVGLALATSLSSAVNLVLLVFMIRRSIGRIGGASLLLSVSRSLFCALVMGFCVHTLAISFFTPYNGSSFKTTTGLALCILAGVAVYAVLTRIMKSPELGAVLALFNKNSDKGKV
jgi:putative peptidoglycan lipid II flippase